MAQHAVLRKGIASLAAVGLTAWAAACLAPASAQYYSYNCPYGYYYDPAYGCQPSDQSYAAPPEYGYDYGYPDYGYSYPSYGYGYASPGIGLGFAFGGSDRTRHEWSGSGSSAPRGGIAPHVGPGGGGAGRSGHSHEHHQ